MSFVSGVYEEQMRVGPLCADSRLTAFNDFNVANELHLKTDGKSWVLKTSAEVAVHTAT